MLPHPPISPLSFRSYNPQKESSLTSTDISEEDIRPANVEPSGKALVATSSTGEISTNSNPVQGKRHWTRSSNPNPPPGTGKVVKRRSVAGGDGDTDLEKELIDDGEEDELWVEEDDGTVDQATKGTVLYLRVQTFPSRWDLTDILNAF